MYIFIKHIKYFFQYNTILGWQTGDPVAYQTKSLQKDSINLCVDIDNTHYFDLCDNCKQYIMQDTCFKKTQITHKSDRFLMTILKNCNVKV